MGDTAVRSEPARLARRLPWAAISTITLATVLVVLVIGGQRQADLVSELGSKIRCPVCQGVPIADSPAPMARDMMAVLTEAVSGGATRQEAIDAVLGAYPGSLLLEPPLSPATLALWLLPLGALLAGAALAFTVRRGRHGVEERMEHSDLIQRRDQVCADLDDLAAQEAAGEVDWSAARHLRAAYEAELAETESALAATTATSLPLPRSRRRSAVGALVLVGSLVAVVLAAGAFLIDRPDATSGVADVADDPAEFSNETLAAVIAANLDHPQIDGMRLALAERYFEAGDYPSAFPYYLDVAESDRATPTQTATSLSRMAWMTYAGNGESETALELLAEARQVAPDDPFPRFLEGVISWCGLGDFSRAEVAFAEVLASTQVDDAIRGQVESDLALVRSGTECPG